MLAVPISFVSEHIETLEEIDVEYRELAESVGIEHWGRVPALNTNEVFIKDLSQAILEALPSANKMAQPLLDSLVPAGSGLEHLEICIESTTKGISNAYGSALQQNLISFCCWWGSMHLLAVCYSQMTTTSLLGRVQLSAQVAQQQDLKIGSFDIFWTEACHSIAANAQAYLFTS